jgi:hypothetical protein
VQLKESVHFHRLPSFLRALVLLTSRSFFFTGLTTNLQITTTLFPKALPFRAAYPGHFGKGLRMACERKEYG